MDDWIKISKKRINGRINMKYMAPKMLSRGI